MCSVCWTHDVLCAQKRTNSKGTGWAQTFSLSLLLFIAFIINNKGPIGLLHVATYNNALSRNFVVVSLSFFRVNFVIVKENFILVHSRYFTMATNAFLAEIILYKLVSDACTTAV